MRIEGTYAVFQGTAEVKGNQFSVGASTLAVQYGKVGIGTSTPSFLLHVSSAPGVAGDLVVISTGASNVIRMTGAGDIYANKFYGDGTSLSGIATLSDLGSKISGSGTPNWVTKYQASGVAIVESSIYDDGETTVLTNPSSVTVYGKDAASGYTLVLSSGIYMPGGTVNAGRVLFNNNIVISSEPSAAYGGGVRVSTNMYIVGFASATKYYGDGSSLTGITASGAGDNLGNHIATTTLNMAGFNINGVSTVTAAGYVDAARYLINKSTIMAILPGYKSFAIGINAGILNGANADYNLFVGEQAGESNVTGDDNAFFGYKAGYLNTASDNTFIGYEVGYYNSSGFSNVFVGHQAGFSNETGSDNTFVGKYAGGNGYNGSHSSLFGSNAGYANSGDNNSFVGSSAGHDNTTGANNSILGYQAGFENRTGSANSIFGAQAGYGVSANSYSSSTLVGYKAGFAVTTGSDNLLLGFQSGDSLTTGSHNIIIGYDEDAPAATTNDYINIGGLLHGDMALSTMTVYGDLYANHFYGDISGASGLPSGDDLGNHIATQSLNMAGYQITNVSTMTVSSITTTAAGVVFSTNVFITQGKVGIGITSPSSQLHVVVPTTDMNALVIATGTAAGQEIVRISTSGVIYAKGGITYGGDLAEMYLVEGEVEAGDVVMLAKSGSEGVAVERAEGMGVLMGVVATRPGMMLGDGDLGETGTRVPVALSGRVPVKASLENGPIRAGSLLSISSKPGWAAAAIHTGPVMGMALEDFDPRKGDTVLCFVNRHYWVEPGELEQLRDELDRVKAELRRR